MTEAPRDATIMAALKRVSDGGRFTEREAHELMLAIMDGKADTTQIAALLMGLRVRGETVAEVTGFARAMREKSHRIHIPHTGRLVDTCGTGGAPFKTFNVGTASAFVTAGADAIVAKHGNRSVTSPCGSADLLEALGADLTRPPQDVAQIVQRIGVGFLFAPNFHPAMKHAIPARKALGVRTIFNVLGPLTNPASAEAQVMGVFDPQLVEPLAHVLANLGVHEAMVVHGAGGLDEVSTLGPTHVAHVRDGGVESLSLEPSAYGITKAKPQDIGGLPPAESARFLVGILTGKDSPRADQVLFNAACAILVAGKASDLAQALHLARESVSSGAAREKLVSYIEATGGRLAGGA